jgi:hypothetical protein
MAREAGTKRSWCPEEGEQMLDGLNHMQGAKWPITSSVHQTGTTALANGRSGKNPNNICCANENFTHTKTGYTLNYQLTVLEVV